MSLPGKYASPLPPGSQDAEQDVLTLLGARGEAQPLLPHVRKLAVLRANAIGDYIFALPALYALRRAYPHAQITLLGKPWHVDFLEGRPGPVDRVIAVPPSKGVNEPADGEDQKALAQFFAHMQAEKFDLALQMHGGGRYSNPFVLKLGARYTAGMKTPDALPLDRWMPYFYWQHEVSRLLEVASLVGALPVILEPHLDVTQRDLDESCQVVPQEAVPLVILHPGASDPRRRWPTEKFAAVGDALVRHGCRVAVVGVTAERELIDRVLAAMREPALDLCGKLSLQGLAGLIRRARVVVANDSGPRHLAWAIGTPTVGIYWCGNLINAGAAFRTRHRPHLSWRLDCTICGRNTIHDRCEHDASFMDEVQVEEVLESALDLLKQ